MVDNNESSSTSESEGNRKSKSSSGNSADDEVESLDLNEDKEEESSSESDEDNESDGSWGERISQYFLKKRSNNDHVVTDEGESDEQVKEHDYLSSQSCKENQTHFVEETIDQHQLYSSGNDIFNTTDDNTNGRGTQTL